MKSVRSVKASRPAFDTLHASALYPSMPLPPGFVPPCRPAKAPQPPTGETWLHEIKHDGFRVIAARMAHGRGCTAAQGTT
jgi:ATP-dependent DNA ligase